MPLHLICVVWKRIASATGYETFRHSALCTFAFHLHIATTEVIIVAILCVRGWHVGEAVVRIFVLTPSIFLGTCAPDSIFTLHHVPRDGEVVSDALTGPLAPSIAWHSWSDGNPTGADSVRTR